MKLTDLIEPSEAMTAARDVMRSAIDRVIQDINKQREQYIRQFMRDNRTHRMNVYILNGRWPRMGPIMDDGTMTITEEFECRTHKPKGWVAPLP